MSSQSVDVRMVVDLTERGPMELKDWIALYPGLPERTISLCIWEARNNGNSHDAELAQNAAIVRLIWARLDEARCVVSST